MHLVVTASATLNGQPLYRSADGSWSGAHVDAQTFASKAEAEAALAVARREESLVCDPYLVEADASTSAPHFVSLKERIRATGPTVAIL